MLWHGDFPVGNVSLRQDNNTIFFWGGHAIHAPRVGVPLGLPYHITALQAPNMGAITFPGLPHGQPVIGI